MAKLRQFRVFINTVVAVGLLVNLVAAVLCCAPSKGIPSDYPVALLGPLVMCSDHAADGASGNAPGPDQSTKCCPLCLSPVALAFFVVLTALIGLLVVPIGRFPRYTLVTLAADDLRRSGLGSRAPPLAA